MHRRRPVQAWQDSSTASRRLSPLGLRRAVSPAAARPAARASFQFRVVFRLARRDRKSTRLNSSHQIISYAVFCLKKKKKSAYSTAGNPLRDSDSPITNKIKLL